MALAAQLSARLRAEAALQSVMENSPDNIIRYDLDCRAIYANRMMEKTLNINISDTIGKQPTERLINGVSVVGTEAAGNYQEKLQQVIDSGVPDNIEIIMLDLDGNPLNHLIQFVAERDHDGKIIGALAFGIDITERRRTERELLESRQQLRELSVHQQTLLEEERTRIARELHDELGQLLTGIKLDAMWLERHLLGDRPNVTSKVTSMSQLIDVALNAVHRVATDLRPEMLDDLGLRAAIEWLTEEFAKRTGIDFNLEIYGQPQCGNNDCSCIWEVGNLNEELTTAVYRILQECLTNVARHAQATHVQVLLQCQDGKFMFRVTDNGKGIHSDNSIKRKSYGIIGMRERTRSLGATLNFSSAEKNGTSVEFVMPIELIKGMDEDL